MQKAQNSCFRQKESRMPNSFFKKFWYALNNWVKALQMSVSFCDRKWKTENNNRLHLILVNLKNNLHVALRLFSKKSQMTSKCGKNKEAHWYFYHICDIIKNPGNMDSICFVQ